GRAVARHAAHVGRVLERTHTALRGNKGGFFDGEHVVTSVADRIIMGSYDHSATSLAHVPKSVDNHLGVCAVESASGLVSKYQGWLLEHQTGQCHTLLFSTAQVVDH